MADARNKAVAALLPTWQDVIKHNRAPCKTCERDLGRVLDAVPAEVLVDLAIERGALEMVAHAHQMPSGRWQAHDLPTLHMNDVPLYRWATDGGGDG